MSIADLSPGFSRVRHLEPTSKKFLSRFTEAALPFVTHLPPETLLPLFRSTNFSPCFRAADLPKIPMARSATSAQSLPDSLLSFLRVMFPEMGVLSSAPRDPKPPIPIPASTDAHLLAGLLPMAPTPHRVFGASTDPFPARSYVVAVLASVMTAVSDDLFLFQQIQLLLVLSEAQNLDKETLTTVLLHRPTNLETAPEIVGVELAATLPHVDFPVHAVGGSV